MTRRRNGQHWQKRPHPCFIRVLQTCSYARTRCYLCLYHRAAPECDKCLYRLVSARDQYDYRPSSCAAWWLKYKDPQTDQWWFNQLSSKSIQTTESIHIPNARFVLQFHFFWTSNNFIKATNIDWPVYRIDINSFYNVVPIGAWSIISA